MQATPDIFGGGFIIMIFVVGNGIDDMNPNPGWVFLSYFTLMPLWKARIHPFFSQLYVNNWADCCKL